MTKPTQNFNEQQVSTYEGIRKFIKGGNAIFTIRNEKTKNRYTYKFKQNQGNPDIYWVYLLCQADNTNDKSYHFLGGYSEEKRYLHSKNSQIKQNTTGALAIAWFCDVLHEEKMPEYVKFYHLSHCGRCGKQLTDPESIINGFGAECLKNEKSNGFLPIKKQIESIQREIFPEEKMHLTEQQQMVEDEYQNISTWKRLTNKIGEQLQIIFK